MKEQGGEDFSRTNRLVSPGLSPPNSFLLPGTEVRRGLGRRAKCLSARRPRTLVKGQPEAPFSLTIGLQLVGELEKEVLVVDDLELAHIGLGLQVMRGGLHIKAWGCEDREAVRVLATLLLLHTYQPEEKGVDWDRCWAGGPPRQAKERMEK